MFLNRLILRNTLLYTFVLISLLSRGQQPIQSTQEQRLSAFEYFQKRQFAEVDRLLSQKDRLSKSEEALLYISQLKTGTSSARKVAHWLTQNPEHPLVSLASFHIGEWFFYKEHVVQSRKYLQKVLPRELSTIDQASYGFVFGVLQLEQKNYENAVNLFQYASERSYPDEPRLLYYQSFASYHLGDSEEALEGFQQLTGHYDLGSSSRFFVAKILLDSQAYDQVIALSKQELTEERSITNSGFYQLLGEAYAQKGNVSLADTYFEKAIQLHPDQPTPALYYQAGVSKFKIGDAAKAIEFFTASGVGAGEYAQLSAFQLGKLYAKEQDYELSLIAFKEASSSEDATIKEESLYQSAILAAKLEKYTEAINYSNDYLAFFPKGSKAGEMNDLIAQSYLRTSNFDLAIEHLEQLGLSTSQQKNVYQKVTFQKGQQLFNDEKFQLSEVWLKKSLNAPMQKQLTDLVYYHLAEICMRQGRYSEAKGFYNKQSTIDAASNYGLGYAFYNTNQYQKAVPHFRDAAKYTSDLEMKRDAHTRQADCLYATKAYVAAYALYQQLQKEKPSSYISYQAGLVAKSLGKKKEAINFLDAVAERSHLKDDAILLAGTIYEESTDFQRAYQQFTALIVQYPNSPLLVEAYMKRGTSSKNLGNYEQAKNDYARILEDFLSTKQAISAILGLQELKSVGVDVRKLDQYVAAYKEAHPADGSLEVVEYEAAKNLYFDLSYASAIPSLQQFLQNYPESSHRTEATYFLADSYYRTEQLEAANEAFKQLQYVKNRYTGRVLNRLGEINSRLQDLTSAIKYYTLLQNMSLSDKDTYNARLGLMKAYFDSQRFSDCIESANSIIEASWKPLNATSRATLYKGNAWLALGNEQLATFAFEELAEGEGAFAAQAKYQLAAISYREGRYEDSLDQLFQLNKAFGSYTEWVDKSYLLIAENYIATDELFQAKATLRSIVQHSKSTEIQNQASERLTQIESRSLNDSTAAQE